MATPARDERADRSSLSGDRWDRLAPLTGAAAVVLWVIGAFLLFQDEPESDAAPAEFSQYYDENSGAILVGTFIFGLGTLLFLWFVSVLREHLQATGARGTRVPGPVFAAGIVTGSMLLGMMAPHAAAAIQIEDGDAALSGEAAEALWHLSTGFFFSAELAAALFVIATAVAVLRTGILPRWLAWVSLALALLLLIPPIGWLGLLFGLPLWTLLVSFLLWQRVSAGHDAEPASS